MAKLNGGSRSKFQPYGGCSVSKEITAKQHPDNMLRIIHTLEEHGAFWWVENPQPFCIFHIPGLLELRARSDVALVNFHQYMHHLRPPEWTPASPDWRVPKATSILTNMVSLPELGITCDHQHTHGGIRFSEGGRKTHHSSHSSWSLSPGVVCSMVRFGNGGYIFYE